MLEKKVKLLGSQHYNLISMINLIQMEFPSCIPYVGLNIVLNISRTSVKIVFFLFCLFNLILYVHSTIFQLNRDGSSWVEPVLS